ncbi:hypothetical protein [Roseiarcus sp.]
MRLVEFIAAADTDPAYADAAADALTAIGKKPRSASRMWSASR